MRSRQAAIGALLVACAGFAGGQMARAATTLTLHDGPVTLELLGDPGGTTLDALRAAMSRTLATAGSAAWARQLQGLLRDGGYPFARVALPPVGSGPVLVAFGQLQGVPRWRIAPELDASRLQAMYLHALCPTQPAGAGCIVRSHNLERATALVSLQPEVGNVDVALDPDASDARGRIGLSVEIQAHRHPLQVAATVDNAGTPGLGRAHAGLRVDAANLIPGGALAAEFDSSERRDWTGGVSWIQGLGVSGLQMDTEVTRTTYADPVGAFGTVNGVATSASLGLRYPLALNFARVLNVQGDLGMVVARASLSSLGALQRRRIPYVELKLSGGSGLRALERGRDEAHASVSLRIGRTSDSAPGAAAQDAYGAQLLGSFARLAAELHWHRELGLSPWSAGVLLRGQLASRNLDPSQQIAVGGPDGVRGYRVDEGGFDDGAIASVSVERALDPGAGVQLLPQAFVDYAVGRLHHRSWAGWNAGWPGLSNSRRLGAIGLGLRASKGLFSGDLSVARQLPGVDVSLVDPASKTQLWASAQWQF